MTTAKQTILTLLHEQGHPEKVENVIVWALDHYAKKGDNTMGEIIAYAMVKSIRKAEKEAKGIIILEKDTTTMNPLFADTVERLCLDALDKIFNGSLNRLQSRLESRGDADAELSFWTINFYEHKQPELVAYCHRATESRFVTGTQFLTYFDESEEQFWHIFNFYLDHKALIAYMQETACKG